MKQGSTHEHRQKSMSSPADSGSTGFQPVRKFRIYRRNLPHWEEPGRVYFITFRAVKDFILTEEARDVVINSIKFHSNRKCHLHACVIMPDHIHLIIQPLEKTGGALYSIAEILHSIKSYSANQINRLLNRRGNVWLHESFDRIIRDEDELAEKMRYIVNNPLKSALVENPEDYKWLYVEGWLAGG